MLNLLFICIMGLLRPRIAAPPPNVPRVLCKPCMRFTKVLNLDEDPNEKLRVKGNCASTSGSDFFLVGDPMWNTEGNIYHLATSLWELAVVAFNETRRGNRPQVVIPSSWSSSSWVMRMFYPLLRRLRVRVTAYRKYRRFCLPGVTWSIRASQPFRADLVPLTRAIMMTSCNHTDRMYLGGPSVYPVLLYNRPKVRSSVFFCPLNQLSIP